MRHWNTMAKKHGWMCLLAVFAMAGYSLSGCATAPAGGGGGGGDANDNGAGNDNGNDNAGGGNDNDNANGGGGGNDNGNDNGGAGGGDLVAGQTVFADDCMVCHGDPGMDNGAVGPDIAGQDAAAIAAALTGGDHPAFDDLNDDDFANLGAFLNDDGGGTDNGNDNGNGGGGETREFAGAATCMPCHADTHTDWTETRHATAMETLSAIGQAANAVCLPCHTVGFENGGFVSLEATPEYAGVQCENCHGAAAEHAANPGDAALRPPLNMAATLCGECHTDAHHPTFDEWQLSRHATAVDTLKNNDHAQGFCLDCHSQDYRYALDLQEAGDADVEVPTIETAQLSIECVTCHNPHAETGEPAQMRDSIANVCGECHTSGDALPDATPHHPQLDMVEGGGAFNEDGSALAQAGPHSGLFASGGEACAQCHVVKHEVEEPNEGNPNVTGHTFNPFDESITEVSPEHQAEQYAGCTMCHSAEEADMLRTDVQAEIAGRLETLAAFFDAESDSFIDAEMLSAEDRDSYDVARFNYLFVEADASNGVHNSTYARTALDIAESVLTALSE